MARKVILKSRENVIAKSSVIKIRDIEQCFFRRVEILERNLSRSERVKFENEYKTMVNGC